MVFNSLKGQVSIEFILIIVLMMMLIQTIIEPSINLASNALADIKRVGEAKAASQKLVNALDELALSGDGAVKTIFLFVPENSVVKCDEDNKRVVFDANLSSEATACQPPAETIQPPDNDAKNCRYALQTIAIINCITADFNGLAKGRTFEVRLSKVGVTVNVG